MTFVITTEDVFWLLFIAFCVLYGLFCMVYGICTAIKEKLRREDE